VAAVSVQRESALSPTSAEVARRIESDDFFRYELKFRLPVERMDEIRRLVDPFTQYDKHCAETPGNRYTVRSVYFDSDELEFYFEKLDSVRIRKKLRVRTYDRPNAGHPAFLEIKRKFGRRGFKERLCLPLRQVDGALNGKDPREIVSDRSFSERRVLDRFRFNLRNRDLKPVVLVTYEREARIGRFDDRVRVTFDSNLRSLINPDVEQIFEDDQLKQFEDKFFVLELKFDGSMPKWMANVIKVLNIKSHSYSKYCHGIDAWTPHAK
jgi:SPX domain protein involved in polyphosphate accumulation